MISSNSCCFWPLVSLWIFGELDSWEIQLHFLKPLRTFSFFSCVVFFPYRMVCPCLDTAVQSVSSFRPLLHITVPTLFFSFFEVGLFVPCCHNQSLAVITGLVIQRKKLFFLTYWMFIFWQYQHTSVVKSWPWSRMLWKSYQLKWWGSCLFTVLWLLSRERLGSVWCQVFCNATIPTGRKKC